MYDQSSRRPDGGATPPTCPDCGKSADGDTHRHAPFIRHDDSCPVQLAERERALADVRELDRLRAAGADPVLRRPIAWAELVGLEQTMPAPLPRKVRRAVIVVVVQAGPDTLLRTIEYLGVARAAMLATVPAGAR